MGKGKTEGPRKNRAACAGKNAALWSNFLGILLAVGIASGGLLLVHRRLASEEEALLHQGGSVTIQMQSEAMPDQAVEDEGAVPALLTEEQLYLTVKNLEYRVGTYPHEPWEGQLTMGEAARCGMEWIEMFLLPHMGADSLDADDFGPEEYSVNCYLWAWQEDAEAGIQDPAASYWNVWVDTRELTVDLTLDAVTGQVLSAYVSSSLVMEYQEKDIIRQLLCDYADSFGLGGKYTMFIGGSETPEGDFVYGELRQSIGEKGVYASVNASSVVVAAAEGTYWDTKNIFMIELRLGTNEALTGRNGEVPAA